MIIFNNDCKNVVYNLSDNMIQLYMKGWINMSKKKKNKKENKISKKNIIIIVLAVLVVILVCVVGWFVYRNSLENKTTGSKWSDKYYEFLKSQNNGNKLNWMFTNKSEISFVNSKEIEDPLMLVKNETKCSGNNDNCESVNILGIVDGEVRYFVGTSAKKESVKLYYDIEKKEYKYYLKSTYDNNENYVSLDTIVTDYEKYDVYNEAVKRNITDFKSEEYYNLLSEMDRKKNEDATREVISITEENSKVAQETVDGKTIEYNAIDGQLVDTEVTPKYFEFEKDMKPIKIREEIIGSKDDYKELDDQVTKAIEKVVEKQIDLIEQTKKDIEKAKEEKQAADEAKRAEEEKKKAEEAARLGLKVGSYTLKYGKYIGAAADEGHVLVLNPNGACTYNGASCTYSVGTHDFAQDESTRGSYHTCLIINADFTFYLMPYTNTSIGDGDIGEFNYAG